MWVGPKRNQPIQTPNPIEIWARMRNLSKSIGVSSHRFSHIDTQTHADIPSKERERRLKARASLLHIHLLARFMARAVSGRAGTSKSF